MTAIIVMAELDIWGKNMTRTFSTEACSDRLNMATQHRTKVLGTKLQPFKIMI